MSKEVKEIDVKNIIKKVPIKKLLSTSIVGFIVLFIIFGIIFGLRYLINFQHNKEVSERVIKPTPVSAVKAKSLDWTPYLESTGYIQSINGINITSQVSGIVTSINFKSGEMVKKGDILFEIEHNSLNAQLKKKQAVMEIAQITYLRNKNLYKNKAVSEQQLDLTEAKYHEAKAGYEEVQANINNHIITAPFSGKLGIRQIEFGQYFKAGGVGVSLNDIHPIYVNFNIVENDISYISVGQKINVKSTAYPNKIYEGEITSINSTLSSKTRSLVVQGTLENQDRTQLLLPLMFTTVHILLAEKKNIITVPSSAINHTLYGNSVFVLYKSTTSSPNNSKQGQIYIAKEKMIKIGASLGLDTIIISGLRANDLVVSSGQLKVKNNSKVIINNDIKLNNANIHTTGVLKIN